MHSMRTNGASKNRVVFVCLTFAKNGVIYELCATFLLFLLVSIVCVLCIPIVCIPKVCIPIRNDKFLGMTNFQK